MAMTLENKTRSDKFTDPRLPTVESPRFKKSPAEGCDLSDDDASDTIPEGDIALTWNASLTLHVSGHVQKVAGPCVVVHNLSSSVMVKTSIAPLNESAVRAEGVARENGVCMLQLHGMAALCSDRCMIRIYRYDVSTSSWIVVFERICDFGQQQKSGYSILRIVVPPSVEDTPTLD